ncbi:Permease of the major facilitator superfamily protein [Paenibacillus sp. FSL R7-277]|uniref:MFS transporter n=1 Tax=Paenibacillus sp. FSL R7-277 TaxID=1227352 RepID=UPI0003E2C72C|nr:MFS transporter [Paenibacillus sp. FSL R7-277]ETT76564.1 Permease of the major facilitator superfamily protein [Paenibacillus sp. FSL R7-277]
MERSTKQGNSLLHNKTYMRVYSAFATASFGDWFDALAIQVLVGYRWQAGPLMLALIPVALALPSILLGSIAGVAADRLNKLKLMRICDLLTALLTLLVLFAPSMVWLLPLLALRSALSTLNMPAQQSLTRSLVREDQLLHASSLNGLVNQGSKIAGPLLGGLALAFLTPQWCILLNALLRSCSYLLLLSVKNIHTEEEDSKQPEAPDNKIPLRTMWREGWSFMLRSRLLLNTMLFGLAGSLVIQVVDFQFTSLFRVFAPDRESLLGWMVAATGAGAVLIILILNKLKLEAGYGWKLGSGYVLIGGSIAALGMLQPGASMIWVLLIGFVLGIGNGVFMITFNYCLQKETPPHMTGRIFGIQNTVLSTVLIVAPLLGGVLVQYAGPARIFVNIGLLQLLLGLMGVAFRRQLWPVARSTAKAAQPAVESS